jgi:hypothetical protein
MDILCENSKEEHAKSVTELLRVEKKIRDSTRQANYTDRATAACRRSLVSTLADRGCRVVSATNPHGR